MLKFSKSFAKKKLLTLPTILGSELKFTLQSYTFLSTPSATGLLKFPEIKKKIHGEGGNSNCTHVSKHYCLMTVRNCFLERRHMVIVSLSVGIISDL